MYHPSSNSPSSSQAASMSTAATTTTTGGQIRYASGPSPLAPVHFFPSEPSQNDPRREDQHHTTTTIGLQSAYARFPQGGPTTSSSNLVRQSSSPVGFLEQLGTTPAPHHDSGFSITRGIGGSYNSHEGGSGIVSRLNSQLSFNQLQEAPNSSRDQTSDHHHRNVATTADGFGRADHHNDQHHAQRKSNHSHTSTGFAIGSTWDNANQTMFTVGSSKQPDHLNSMESQFQFGMPESALEAATMDKLLHIPQDSVACKLRAKRGCATHPRSIAERERRTRISGKLKKLQDLVPNMDKQTSYADMLDLAVQHINGLQHQVQKLNEELKHCKCGCKTSKPQNS